MLTKIVSAIYFDLYGSDLGGRPCRNEHYLYSLNSIMNIRNTPFIVYSNDPNRIHEFFIKKYPDKLNSLTIIAYDLYNNEYKNKINKLKKYNEVHKSVRCIELQYSKLKWLEMNAKESDYVYWIDAGLSYSGLLPDKYLCINSKNYYDKYYSSNIFTSKMIDNINTQIQNKIFCIGKDNIDFFWDHGLPQKYYNNTKDSSRHIIGGIFGGRIEKINQLYSLFYNLCNNVLDNENILYSEENFLTTIYYNNLDMFHMEPFDLWWHEDNIASNVRDIQGKDMLQKFKSFYKILEQFI